MLKIILSDSQGGVLSVSNDLMDAMNRASLDCDILNMSDYGSKVYSRLLKSLKSILVESRNTPLLLQHFEPIFLGLFLPILGFKRIVNVVHTDLVEYYNGANVFKQIIIAIVFFIIRKRLIVFVSREAELKAINKFKLKNTSTIYNIFNFQSLKLNRNRKLASGIVLGVVSRLHKLKNVDLAILVVSELRKKNIDIELNIYGGRFDDEFQKLKEFTKVLNASSFIHFFGRVNHKESIFSSIDGLMSFSSIEGLPTVILESINYGVPVFFTDCSSGPREIMSPGGDILRKTTSYERTSVGYLVRPVLARKKYKPLLSDYERAYVDYLAHFIEDIIKFKFSMSFDADRFSARSVLNQWKKLLPI
jgi:glycosyltransferase involved in cell wall biosynthesis